MAARNARLIAGETERKSDGSVLESEISRPSPMTEEVLTAIARAYLRPLLEHVHDLLSISTPALGPIPVFPVTTTQMRGSMIDAYEDFGKQIRKCNPHIKPFEIQEWVIEDEQSAYQTESDHPSNRRFKQIAEQCERLPHPAIPRLDGY